MAMGKPERPKLSDPARMKATIATETPPPGSLKRVVRRLGVFDGSLHEVTRAVGASGEWPEGWATARSADGKHVLLQVCDHEGNCVRIPMTPEQAWGLKAQLEIEALEVKSNERGEPPNDQAERPG